MLCIFGLYQHRGQCFHHGADIDRLGNVRLHACFCRCLLVLLKGVGRHGEDRNACKSFIREAPDCSRRLIPVHYGHLDIHQDRIVVTRLGCGNHVHRDLPVLGGFHPEAGLRKNHHGDFHIDQVVLNQQQPFGRKVDFRLFGVGFSGSLLLSREIVFFRQLEG